MALALLTNRNEYRRKCESAALFSQPEPETSIKQWQLWLSSALASERRKGAFRTLVEMSRGATHSAHIQYYEGFSIRSLDFSAIFYFYKAFRIRFLNKVAVYSTTALTPMHARHQVHVISLANNQRQRLLCSWKTNAHFTVNGEKGKWNIFDRDCQNLFNGEKNKELFPHHLINIAARSCCCSLCVQGSLTNPRKHSLSDFSTPVPWGYSLRLLNLCLLEDKKC